MEHQIMKKLVAKLRRCLGNTLCHYLVSKASFAVRPRSTMLVDPLATGEFETVVRRPYDL